MSKHWLPEETEYLCEYWGRRSMTALRRRLKRTKSAISQKAYKLGLGAFLENGDYITLNQFTQYLGYKSSVSKDRAIFTTWKFPFQTQKIGKSYIRVVYLDDFWKWANVNRSKINWYNVEKNIFGKEPAWVQPLRKAGYIKAQFKSTPWTANEDRLLISLVNEYRYTWSQISKKMRRTEGALQRRLANLKIKGRPLKAETRTFWTPKEIDKLVTMLKMQVSYEVMSLQLGKSTKAIRSKAYKLRKTESVDRAAASMDKRN